MSQGPCFRIEVAVPFWVLNQLKRRSIHSKDHHQRNLIKNQPNQKNQKARCLTHIPILLQETKKKPLGLSLSPLEITVGPTACASLDLKQVKLKQGLEWRKSAQKSGKVIIQLF